MPEHLILNVRPLSLDKQGQPLRRRGIREGGERCGVNGHDYRRTRLTAQSEQFRDQWWHDDDRATKLLSEL